MYVFCLPTINLVIFIVLKKWSHLCTHLFGLYEGTVGFIEHLKTNGNVLFALRACVMYLSVRYPFFEVRVNSMYGLTTQFRVYLFHQTI